MLIAGLLRQDETTEEISESAESLWDTALDALPRVGVAALIVVLGYLLSRGVRWSMFRVWKRRRSRSFARVMSKLVGWVVLTVIVLLAIALTFPSVRPVDLLAGLGFFSVAVGFAFQDILENTFAGVLLLFRQPFVSGDQIHVVDREGVVEGITIRETRIRGYDGDLVVIPNRDVYKNVIVVSTETAVHRQTVTVGVAYDTDLAGARDAIVSGVRSVDAVHDEPAPVALVSRLNTSTIDIDVHFWTDSRKASILQVRDAVIAAIVTSLADAGVEMPADIVELAATTSLEDVLRRTTRSSES